MSRSRSTMFPFMQGRDYARILVVEETKEGHHRFTILRHGSNPECPVEKQIEWTMSIASCQRLLDHLAKVLPPIPDPIASHPISRNLDSSNPKLVGLAPIRKCLQLSMGLLSKMTGIEKTYLSKIANLHCSCGLKNLGILAEVLCCTETDLLVEPSDSRLSSIRLRYLNRAVKRQEENMFGKDGGMVL